MGERSPDSVRKVKKQKVKGQILGNRIILDHPHFEKETENIKKSKTKIRKVKNWKVEILAKIDKKEGEFKQSAISDKNAASFDKMSFNTNMNNGTSTEDIERVGKLEGKSKRIRQNSRISWNSCFFMNHEKNVFREFFWLNKNHVQEKNYYHTLKLEIQNLILNMWRH